MQLTATFRWKSDRDTQTTAPDLMLIPKEFYGQRIEYTSFGSFC
jgi:hypothetical protein